MSDQSVNVSIRATSGLFASDTRAIVSDLKSAMATVQATLGQVGAQAKKAVQPAADSIAELRKMFAAAAKDSTDYNRAQAATSTGSVVLAGNLGGLARNAGALTGSLGGLGGSLGHVLTGLGTAGLAGAIIGATTAIPGLVDWVKRAREEHELLVETARSLHLKVEDVKRYSEGMADLALHLRDVAFGLSVLSDVDQRNFSALGINARDYSHAVEQAMQKIYASRGTDEEKVYAWAKLTNQSYDQAKLALEAYEKTLDRVVYNNRRGGLKTYGETVGVVKNSGPPTSSLGITGASELAEQQRQAQVVADFYAREAEIRKKQAKEIAEAGAQAEKEAQRERERGIAERTTETRALAAAMKQSYDTDVALNRQAVDAKLQLGRVHLDESVANLRRQADTGAITHEQELQGVRSLEIRRFQIESQALDARILLAENEVVEHQRLMDQRELLEAEHQARLRQIAAAGAAETKQPLKELLDGMQAGVQPVLAAFLNMTLSVKNMMRGLAAAVADAMMQLAAKVITTKLAEFAATKAIHVKEIAMNAKGAAAGAYKAIAGIPYVGPVLAPIAAGVALGAVMKFASAAGGYDIPAGVNPMTQLHAKEMVLPAKHADVIRSIAEGGGAAGGGGMGHTINIKAIDASGFASFLRNGGGRAILEELSRGTTGLHWRS